ncbi:hypothetical protein EDD37DRAFT_611279 [Exophiala viscosa]|uniref:uncharacterized protein n=1 Tax=Exophiala viscosa TaxID=2486360 RepID=UPI00219675B6|nr:hypothetical protein EDD37DRAFT_611279 [Exophiala viscosa]
MWTPGNLTRTSSSHSVAMSVASSRGSSFSETMSEHSVKKRIGMWQADNNLVTTSLDLHAREDGRRDSISTDHSMSTLAMDIPHDEDLNMKTPTVHHLPLDFAPDTPDEPEVTHPSHVAGPMEQLLQSLLQKVAHAEQSRPTVMAQDYLDLKSRVYELEAEKKTWEDRYQAYFAVRDEDLTNILKTREMLARERREHEAIRQLRDEDLANVLMLREKLAQALWSKPQRPVSMLSSRQSRIGGDDLWQTAKSTAMEHRILELETANKELQTQVTAGGSTDTKSLMSQMENMFEENLKHREKLASKMQQLRSEKEAMQKELAVLEDRNTELETVVERLQRNLTV